MNDMNYFSNKILFKRQEKKIVTISLKKLF